MPRVRTKFTSSLRSPASAVLLGAASAAAMMNAASAQDAMQLRGSMQAEWTSSSAAVGAQATDPGQTASVGQPAAPIYEPIGPGAVPDALLEDSAAPADANLFGQPSDASDAFGEAKTPSPDPRKPSTASERMARETTDREASGNSGAATSSRNKGETAQDKTPTGTTRVEPVGPVDNIGVPIDGGRTQAIEDIDPLTPEDDPFAPVGIRAGTFILRPSIEQGITASSNANYSVDGQSAVLSETILRLNAVSDWTENSATFDAYGIFRKSISGFEVEDLRAGALGTLNVDISEDLRTTAILGYERAPESAASPVIIPDTVEEPIRQTLIGSLGLEKDAGKARFGITGRVERDVYGEAELEGGGSISQDDRDDTLATVLLRAGYEVSPALIPFVELEGGHRFCDEEEDADGYQRESNRFGARAGVEVDLSEKLTGEISAGWLREKFVDDRLAPIDGPTLNALIAWSPERGTKVDFIAASTVEGTTTPGASGSLLHTAGIAIERRVRSNLTTTAAAGVGYREYVGEDGHDLLFNAEVGATWWLNRHAGITARLRYESQNSDLEGRDYKANTAFLGVKVQR